MSLTRRHLVRSGAATAAAALAGAAGAASARPGRDKKWTRPKGKKPKPPVPVPTPPAGPSIVATLKQTLGFGLAGAGGYKSVVVRAGEPHLQRTDLGVARAGAGVRRPLLAFAQLSDVHVVDAQSPCRVEWTDRLDDKSTPDQPTTGIFASAYRPHEMLSGHIADAMVRQLNAIATGPVTGLPLALAIQTGDNSDNSQANEIRWNIDLLDGAPVRVDSGDLTRWEGVADDDPVYYDPSYYHPHGTPTLKSDGIPRAQRGFPVIPGLLDAARRPFQAEGLRMPWYAAFGNHDGLLQGNFPTRTLQLNALATGPLKVISPPAGLSPAALLTSLQTDPAGLLSSLALSPAARLVTADPDRRLLSRAEIVEQHFTTRGTPVGHGFTAANRAAGTAYYSFDRGVFRFVVMDTVNPNGYADGSLDQAQFGWLQQVLAASDDKVVMVFSHHTSFTMTNPLVGTGGDLDQRVLGGDVLALLLAHDSVIAWVNGHTHKNQVRAHRRADRAGGLWEINTASHIDWPQQSRLIEVVDNGDRTLSIFCTLVDHAGPASAWRRTDDPVALASIARELAANDWHNPGDEQRGTPEGRNVELVTRAPIAVLRDYPSAPTAPVKTKKKKKRRKKGKKKTAARG